MLSKVDLPDPFALLDVQVHAPQGVDRWRSRIDLRDPAQTEDRLTHFGTRTASPSAISPVTSTSPSTNVPISTATRFARSPVSF